MEVGVNERFQKTLVTFKWAGRVEGGGGTVLREALKSGRRMEVKNNI